MIFTPVQRHTAIATIRNIACIGPPKSQLIGFMPNSIFKNALITALPLLAKINRKTVPATTTETREGKKNIALKTVFHFLDPEFNRTDRTRGPGMSISIVYTVYRNVTDKAWKKSGVNIFR